jgi:hypothetical protein
MELTEIIDNKMKDGTMWVAWYEEIRYRWSQRGAYKPEFYLQMWEEGSKTEKNK